MAGRTYLSTCTNDQLFESLSDDFSRGLALDFIGGRAMDDPRSLPLLIDVLANDPEAMFRRTACRSLVHLHGHPEVDALLADRDRG